VKFGVCILSNYEADSQQSMLRYADHLKQMLSSKEIPTITLVPPSIFGGISGGGLKKILGYIDKYLLFPFILFKKCQELRRESIPWIVHIVDHSNALYVPLIQGIPTVITCHDVGAIKGARGELEDCKASFMGKGLQRMILKGLVSATCRACVSEYTRNDFLRFVPESDQKRVASQTEVILNPIRPENKNVFETKDPSILKSIFSSKGIPRYLFHVGSNLRRKNREVILEVFAQWKKEGDFLIFAGEKLSEDLKAKAQSLDLIHSVLDLGPVNERLLASLYQNAFAFLFPSRFEGFGWPIIESQACGGPVLAANNSAMPEVAGGAASLRDSEDIDGFCEDLKKLENVDFRNQMIEKGIQNARRFDVQIFENSYFAIYKKILGKELEPERTS
ncbi:MAG: glycosyltransferase family 1 protein, partial [Verrucomicrobiota bacterium]